MKRLDHKAISKLRASENVDVLPQPLTVRVSLQSYLSAILAGTFFSALLFYLEMDLAGYLAFATSWILIPALGLRDRISFDGRSLVRTGSLPRIFAWLSNSRKRLKLTDIEQVESYAIRTLKRGGNIYYRYRTVFRGKGLTVAIASGGEDYRRMIGAILPKLPAEALDIRSLELREHLHDPKETLMKAEFARIPSGEMAALSIRKRSTSHAAPPPTSKEDAADLRDLANELRMNGHLARALEVFRRALRLQPRDGRLLFEFARCLHSFALAERDPRLERRALAALRLSEKRAAAEADTLTRLGEFYTSLGEHERSEALYRRVLETIGDNFRALRGMAELALTDGKIAHVIHNFAAANRVARTPALRRWASTEAEYFSHLNADDEYMEMEISRVNLLEGLERSKRTALRIGSMGLPAAIVGVVFEDGFVANVGWAVSTVSLIVWAGTSIAARMFATRIPYKLLHTDE